MKEKIYQYLQAKNGAASSQELMRQFFHVHDSHPSHAETILTSLFEDDGRFIRDEHGNWMIRPEVRTSNLAALTFSIIDVESLPISRGHEIPIAIGIAQLKNDIIVARNVFMIPTRGKYSAQVKTHLEALSANFARAPRLDQHVDKLYQLLQNTILVSDSPAKKLATLNFWLLNYLGTELELDRLSLVSLARLMFPDNKIRSLSDIAASLSMIYSEPADLNARLELMAEITSCFIHNLENQSVRSWSDVKNFMERSKNWVDFSRYRFDQDFIKSLPDKPGVYFMKDRSGRVFYVGKAKNLRARVESYFFNRFDLDEKGRKILERISDLSYQLVGSELEAWLWEYHYIHEYRPELNSQLQVHRMDSSPRTQRRVMLFLPGLLENEVAIFWASGADIMVRFNIDRGRADWQALLAELTEMNLHRSERQSDYSADQIEIFWRWFDLNQEQVNFIDLDQCGSKDKCLELVRQYCADPRLFFEKTHYR